MGGGAERTRHSAIDGVSFHRRGKREKRRRRQEMRRGVVSMSGKDM